MPFFDFNSIEIKHLGKPDESPASFFYASGRKSGFF